MEKEHVCVVVVELIEQLSVNTISTYAEGVFGKLQKN